MFIFRTKNVNTVKNSSKYTSSVYELDGNNSGTNAQLGLSVYIQYIHELFAKIILSKI